MMPRIVAPETLDSLAVNDPAAMRSRRDLRRVHRAMGTRSIVVHGLRSMTAPRRQAVPLRVLELGAGDGSLMLGVARALGSTWPPVELTLLDAQALVDRDTIERYACSGWKAVPQVVDVLDWAADTDHSPLEGSAESRWDLIIANLFLHHFEGAQFATLLKAIATRAHCFFACEPRRAWLALAGSHMVGAIGANKVTRQDAVLSVHAGFCRDEISALWPAQGVDWQIREYSAGFFSHCFFAQHVKANA